MMPISKTGKNVLLWGWAIDAIAGLGAGAAAPHFSLNAALWYFIGGFVWWPVAVAITVAIYHRFFAPRVPKADT